MFDTSRFRQHKTKQYNKKIKLIKLAQGGLVTAESEAGLLRLELHGVDTIKIILEAVFTANHLTDTDKQSSIYEPSTTQKPNKAKSSKTKLHGFTCLLRESAVMDLLYNAPEATRARAS